MTNLDCLRADAETASREELLELRGRVDLALSELGELPREQWISINDRLPPMEAGLSWKGKFQCSADYMTYNGHEFQTGKLYISDKDGSKTWTTSRTEAEIYDVTHWANLPKRPSNDQDTPPKVVCDNSPGVEHHLEESCINPHPVVIPDELLESKLRVRAIRDCEFDAGVLAETIRQYLESNRPDSMDSPYAPLSLLHYNLGWWDGKHEPTRELRIESKFYKEGREHPEAARRAQPDAVKEKP